MPRIENKNLEAEGRGSDHEIGQRNSACNLHVCIDAGRLVVSFEMNVVRRSVVLRFDLAQFLPS